MCLTESKLTGKYKIYCTNNKNSPLKPAQPHGMEGAELVIAPQSPPVSTHGHKQMTVIFREKQMLVTLSAIYRTVVSIYRAILAYENIQGSAQLLIM